MSISAQSKRDFAVSIWLSCLSKWAAQRTSSELLAEMHFGEGHGECALHSKLHLLVLYLFLRGCILFVGHPPELWDQGGPDDDSARNHSHTEDSRWAIQEGLEGRTCCHEQYHPIFHRSSQGCGQGPPWAQWQAHWHVLQVCLPCPSNFHFHLSASLQ